MTTDYRSIMLWLLDGRPYTEISTSLGCSRKTISHTKHVLTTQDLTLDQIQNLTSSQIEELFPDNRRRDPAQFLQPDMAAIAKRRMTRTRVTRKVEWEGLSKKEILRCLKRAIIREVYRVLCLGQAVLPTGQVGVDDLKARRVERQLSQAQVAEKLGCVPARISDIETGKRPLPELRSAYEELLKSA